MSGERHAGTAKVNREIKRFLEEACDSVTYKKGRGSETVHGVVGGRKLRPFLLKTTAGTGYSRSMTTTIKAVFREAGVDLGTFKLRN